MTSFLLYNSYEYANMKLTPDVQILIDSASNDLKEIERGCRTNSKLMSEIQIKIKSCLEHMRSALDYISHQVYEENYNSDEKFSPYFPLYCEDHEKFKEFMKKNFPDLNNLNSNVYSKFEKIQYYNDPMKNVWMKDLTIVNEYKHKNLSGHHRMESGFVDIGPQDFPSLFHIEDTSRNIVFVNNYVNGVPMPDMTIDRGKVAFKEPGIDEKSWIRKTKSGDFYFTTLDKPIIETLRSIFEGIKKVKDEFEN